MLSPNHLVPPALAEKMEEWRAKAEEWRPWPYQQLGLKFMLEDSQCGLLLDPGMGKTSISLAAVKVLLKKRLIKRVLVVAPLRAIFDVWPQEMCDWKDFHELGLALLHGPKKEKILRALTPAHQVCLVNPEGLQWLMADLPRAKLLGAEMLIIDESSKFKSGTSQRFRFLRRHLRNFERRHILTGSPRPKNYMDLWSQIYILDQGAALGSYMTHYRNTFFFPTGYEMREWSLLPDSEKQINELIAPMVLRLDAKDYLKLPKVPPDRIHKVELPPAARKEYDKIEDSLMSTLFSSPLVNSAAARSKCSQIANGAVYVDQVIDERWPTRARPTKVVHTAKVDAVVDLYEELQGEPLLLSIGYHHDVTAIRAALGKDIPCINGETTRSQASDFIDRWNKGKLSLMLIHPASAGHGLNLQGCACRHVGYFYIPDDFDHYDQLFRRVWRQGNKAQFVFRHLFVAQNTVDVPKLANLRHKGNGQRDFLNAMRDYAEVRYGKRGKK
jgi:hypothetical protein